MSGGKSPSIDDLQTSFTSIEGRFTITMPEFVSSYQPMNVLLPGEKATGSAFSWAVEEGQYRVAYVDAADSFKDEDKAGQVINTLIEDYLMKVAQANGKMVLNEKKVISGYSGRMLTVEFKDSFLFVRIFFVENRLYQIFFSMQKKHQSKEALGLKILDSIQIFSKTQTEALIQKKIDGATPKLLPQEPISKRATSDAQDERIKGKIKIIIEDNEDLTGSGTVKGRKSSSIKYFSELGNLTKKISYDYRGNPMEITVYGCIDGDRVTNYGLIRYEYDPPPPAMASLGSGQVKRDLRYSSKIKFKYDDKGRLIEDGYYGNDGSLWVRHVYTYKENQVEQISYSSGSSPDSKKLEILDDKGHIIEETYFSSKAGFGESKSKFSYEFDDKGNWLKRITEKIMTKDGKIQALPSTITYRKLIYY